LRCPINCRTFRPENIFHFPIYCRTFAREFLCIEEVDLKSESTKMSIGNKRELWTADTVCEFFGGEKPLNTATLYRGVASGKFPKPINISANLVRWLASECEAALAAMIARRDAGVRTTPRHGGRKKRAA
jgi:predicted DNA-binding transcriptional regulator AlpA